MNRKQMAKYTNKGIERENESLISSAIPDSLRMKFKLEIVKRNITQREAVIEAVNLWLSAQKG